MDGGRMKGIGRGGYILRGPIHVAPFSALGLLPSIIALSSGRVK